MPRVDYDALAAQHGGQLASAPAPVTVNRNTWDLRPDGSKKGDGFLGVLARPDGDVMSEFSIADSENPKLKDAKGTYLDYPTLVPTLTKSEVNYLLTIKPGAPIPSTIAKKAEAHALARIAKGEPVWAQPGEQQTTLYPELSRATVTDAPVQSSGDASGTDYDALAAEHGGEALPVFRETNEKDAQGNAVVRGVQTAWNKLTTPLLPHLADAAHEIANAIDTAKRDPSTGGILDAIKAIPDVARGVWNHPLETTRGSAAGAIEGTGQLAAGFTSPVGIALTLAGVSEDSAIVKQIPALKTLLQLPKVKALQRAVQATAGSGFTAQGADRVLDAQNGSDRLQGAAELATGLAGVASAVAPRGGAPVTPVSRLTPEEQASNTFARANDIPLDAATATGSPSALAAEKRVANSMGGETTASRTIEQQQAGLKTTGATLADATGAAAASPVSAGDSVRDALTKRIAELHQDANDAYGTIRQREADAAATIAKTGGVQAPPNAVRPFTTVPLSVDIGSTKAALKPLYDRMLRESQLAPLQGGQAKTLIALDRLMTGPDEVPLSVADQAVSSFKALARGADIPELRSAGQGTAARAVQAFDAQVRAAAARAGSDVVDALGKGRAATKEKYAVADVLDMFSQEPRQVFNQLTANRDLALSKAKAIQKYAPDQLPVVGRAYLEEMLDHATERGRFDHADKLYADWQKMGSGTKALLFPDPGLRANLDSFFLLAKRLATNPNPSGTAHVNSVFNLVSQPGYWAAAKLLYTRNGVSALTKLLQMAPQRPSATTLRSAAQTAGWAEVVSAAKAAGVPLTTPAMATTDEARQ